MAVAVVYAVATNLVIPVLLIAGLWRGKFPNKTFWIIAVWGSAAFIGYMFLIGRWDWFSYYLRVLMPLVFVVAAYRSFRRIRGAPWWSRPESVSGWGNLGAYGFLAVLFSSFTAVAATGMSAADEQAVELSFPLESSVSYVGQGGGSPQLNYHNAGDSAQRFALDVTSLNVAGTRTLGLLPSDPERYEIFGKRIQSPCTGEVIEAEDGHVDHRGPNTDRQNPAGNHIMVRCETTSGSSESSPEVDVVLAHMSRGSVEVQVGDEIREGEAVGAVGNSGNTTEPHLHIHAVRSGSGESVLDGEGVPMHFDGRFLVRNSLIF